MNELHTTRTTGGSRGITRAVAAISTSVAAVALIAVTGAPASSAPRTYVPIDPNIGLSDFDTTVLTTHDCFMGRHNWWVSNGPVPKCVVG